MIVDCGVYEKGRRRGGEAQPRAGAARPAAPRTPSSGSAWSNPRPRSSRRSRAEFDLHELAVEDAVKAHQRPKVELYGDTLLRRRQDAPATSTPSEAIEVGELLLFVNSDFIITVRHGEGDAELASGSGSSARPDLLAHGTGVVLYAILDHVVDDYGDVAEGVDGEIQAVEREVFSAERTNPVEQIYKLEREVLEFYRGRRPAARSRRRDSRGGRFDGDPDELARVLPRRPRPPARGSPAASPASANCSTAPCRRT